MRQLLIAGLISVAVPASAQDYYSTISAARHGNGYSPSSIVAGWEGDESFAVIAMTPDGQRAGANGVAIDWKAVLTAGPRAEAEDETGEDERYLDRDKTDPKKPRRIGPPVPRRDTVYQSVTCPAVMARIAELKPLTGFEFDPPNFKGNKDGPNGDGREGYDLWIRVGDAELNKSAETKSSALGRWFEDTKRALEGCPGSPKTY